MNAKLAVIRKREERLKERTRMGILVRKWFQYISMASTGAVLVDAMLNNRKKLKQERLEYRSATKIARVWKGWHAWETQRRYERAEKIVKRAMLRFAKRWRERHRKTACKILVRWLRDTRFMPMVAVAIRRYRNDVIFVQRSYRRHLRIVEARIELMTIQLHKYMTDVLEPPVVASSIPTKIRRTVLSKKLVQLRKHWMDTVYKQYVNQYADGAKRKAVSLMVEGSAGFAANQQLRRPPLFIPMLSQDICAELYKECVDVRKQSTTFKLPQQQVPNSTAFIFAAGDDDEVVGVGL